MWTSQDLDLKMAMDSNEQSTRSQLRLSEEIAQSNRIAWRDRALRTGYAEHDEVPAQCGR